MPVDFGRYFLRAAHQQCSLPAGTEHQATSPSGCTILVWSTKVPVKEAG
ncbi:hypothetical protein SAMN00120144_4020 [Hymenobacter roseosalivarius DSM 11622]|uniref:Uncharacterized protein n=2 Tax=Hymenobacter roseosalivarius TaxID=89967 RepID=A0A1W1UHY5_9BACT|nr:hypothetical protein SAMN00120144_4020 [Hymenobacter roseosalivarius DSM 11622]